MGFIIPASVNYSGKNYKNYSEADVIEAKELLGRVEKAMKAKGDDANVHQ